MSFNATCSSNKEGRRDKKRVFRSMSMDYNLGYVNVHESRSLAIAADSKCVYMYVYACYRPDCNSSVSSIHSSSTS